MNRERSTILILDFGSQYSELIARRIRECGVYTEIHHYSHADAVIAKLQPNGIILSGGPESVTLTDTPRIPDSVFAAKCPLLGICYGMQAMAEQLGGRVLAGKHREFGHAAVDTTNESPLLRGIESPMSVWMSHGDQVATCPPGFQSIASTPSCPIAAMEDPTRHYYGLQFHPEVTHTKDGMALLSHFAHEICQCKESWSTKHIITEQVEQIRNTVGKEKVILALSGGVDSSVAARLLQMAIGDQLQCIFVDTGLMRLNERAQIESLFHEHFQMKLISIDAKARYLNSLRGITDPEQKRKIIGKLFIDIFAETAQSLKDVRFLAQGTIYSDVIESAQSGIAGAHVIKSHHNVGGLPENLPFKLIEPLRTLFKDEVRKVGEECGLSHQLLHRHPFPGPGLGIRIMGEVTEEALHTLQHADAILIDELERTGWYHQVSQAFVVHLPVHSVGVLGDARHYAPVVAIRVVQSDDFMTAHVARLPFTLLEHVASRIVNEVKGISRVTYDISSKPPATIEWE